MLPAPVLYNFTYTTSLNHLYVDGLQSGSENLHDTILGLPPSHNLQWLKIIYGTDVRLDNRSLQHWNDIMCHLKREHFPLLQNILLTVYWSNHCTKTYAIDFHERIPGSFPTYNKDLKVRMHCIYYITSFIGVQTTVSVNRDHPFHHLGSLTRAYHLGEIISMLI